MRVEGIVRRIHIEKSDKGLFAFFVTIVLEDNPVVYAGLVQAAGASGASALRLTSVGDEVSFIYSRGYNLGLNYQLVSFSNDSLELLALNYTKAA